MGNIRGGDEVQSKIIAILAFYLPDGKGSQCSQLNPMKKRILSEIGSPLVLISLENLME